MRGSLFDLLELVRGGSSTIGHMLFTYIQLHIVIYEDEECWTGLNMLQREDAVVVYSGVEHLDGLGAATQLANRQRLRQELLRL